MNHYEYKFTKWFFFQNIIYNRYQFSAPHALFDKVSTVMLEGKILENPKLIEQVQSVSAKSGKGIREHSLI